MNHLYQELLYLAYIHIIKYMDAQKKFYQCKITQCFENKGASSNKTINLNTRFHYLFNKHLPDSSKFLAYNFNLIKIGLL